MSATVFHRCVFSARQILSWSYMPIQYVLDKLEAILPSNILHQLSRV